MSDRKSMDDWQLSESSESGDQWQLLDQEQDLPESLQLQDSPDSQYHQWQPVEYEDEQKTSGASWILPTLIIVALLAVLGYIGWLAMNGFDFSGIALQQPTPTEEVAQAGGEPDVAAVPAVPTVEEAAAPTATPVPPTPTLAATPTLEPTPFMVEQRIATIDSQYGLNARLVPDAGAEVTKILDDGTIGVIVDEVPGWVQIELEDGEQLWVSSDFVTIDTEMVLGDPADAPTSQPDPVADTGGAVVVIIADAGINARSESNADGDILQVLPNEASFTVVALSDDGEWVQIELDDGTPAWVTSNEEFVTISGELPDSASPVDEGGEEPVADATATPASEEPTAEPTTAPDVAPEDALVIVDNLVGVLSRAGPSSTAEAADRLPGGTEVPALGRNAEGDWVKVELENGNTAWVFLGSVSLNVDVETLAEVEP